MFKKLFMAGYCDSEYRLWSHFKKKIEFFRNVIFDERSSHELNNVDQPTNDEIVQMRAVMMI